MSVLHVRPLAAVLLQEAPGGNVMKIKLALVAASLALFGSSTVIAQGNRAVHLEIFGAGPLVDERAFRAVRSLIGRSVIDNAVVRFIVAGFGVEGGYEACVELQSASDARLLFSRLQRIRPNPETTEYRVRLTASCPCP